jgi:multiple sugar transport system substrate-binding protein
MLPERKSMSRRLRTAAALTVAALALPLAACSSESGDDGGKVTLNYWLWDDKQLPAYQACADEFTKANPNTTVKFTQTAWQ